MEITSADFIKSGVRRRDYPTDDTPQIAFAGRSNVGKSSLINTLVRRKGLARSSKTPGRTQMVNFFLINKTTYFVDLPGYGYARAPEAEQRRWRPMIEAYLEDNPRLRGVIVLLDCRHEPSVLDLQLLDYLVDRNIPYVPVATKIDKLSRSQRAERLGMLRRTLGDLLTTEVVTFSALKREGRKDLLNVIDRLLDGAYDGGGPE